MDEMSGNMQQMMQMHQQMMGQMSQMMQMMQSMHSMHSMQHQGMGSTGMAPGMDMPKSPPPSDGKPH